MSSSWRTVSNDFSNTFGGNLTLNLLDRDGDRICIFGFSRGAYTARALAGMIEKVGLLPTGNHQQVPFAYRMYLQDDDEGYSTYPSYDERCSDARVVCVKPLLLCRKRFHFISDSLYDTQVSGWQ